MGLRLSTGATARAGTKEASLPRTKSKAPRNILCRTCVDEASVEVIERFGRFQRLAMPGYNCVWSCCLGEQNARRLSLQVQHQEVQCEVRTRDGVFATLMFSAQYRVRDDGAYDAFYSLTEPRLQISSYVLDAVTSACAHMTIDEVFASKASIAHSVRSRLTAVLASYGYTLIDCLVTSIDPTTTVKEAMSNVLAARRQREAAYEQGEAEKVRALKVSEATTDARYLYGQGWARFLQALAAGVRDSLLVLATGRIRREDLTFPEPPLSYQPLPVRGALGSGEQREPSRVGSSRGVPGDGPLLGAPSKPHWEGGASLSPGTPVPPQPAKVAGVSVERLGV